MPIFRTLAGTQSQVERASVGGGLWLCCIGGIVAVAGAIVAVIDRLAGPRTG